MAKSWQEKLNSDRPPKVVVLDRPMMGMHAGTRLYIATPLIVQDAICKIPKGACLSVLELRSRLAREHHADATCPLTTGIFLRIIAEAAHQQMAEGRSSSEVAPFWRVIDPKSPIAKKLTFGAEVVERLRRSEGID